MQQTTLITLQALSNAILKTLKAGTCTPGQANKLIECLSLEPFSQAGLDFITSADNRATSRPGTTDILDKQTLPRLFARALGKNDLSSTARINLATTWDAVGDLSASPEYDAGERLRRTAC